MKLSIEKASGVSICRYDTCDKNPDYISENGRIKSGTICGVLEVGCASGYRKSFFCRECIDRVYKDVKKMFDSTLWILH